MFRRSDISFIEIRLLAITISSTWAALVTVTSIVFGLPARGKSGTLALPSSNLFSKFEPLNRIGHDPIGNVNKLFVDLCSRFTLNCKETYDRPLLLPASRCHFEPVWKNGVF